MKKSKEAIPKHLWPKHADGRFDPNHSKNASLGNKKDSLFPGNNTRKGNHHPSQISHDFSERGDMPSIMDRTHVNKGKHATDHICQPNLSTQSQASPDPQHTPDVPMEINHQVHQALP